MNPFDALGDPVRRRILEHLAAGEQTAGEVVRAVQADLEISQPAVSQHLRALRAAGLVQVRPDGNRRHYSVVEVRVEELRAWLATLVHPIGGFEQPLDALETELRRGRRQRSRAARGSEVDGSSRPA